MLTQILNAEEEARHIVAMAQQARTQLANEVEQTLQPIRQKMQAKVEDAIKQAQNSANQQEAKQIEELQRQQDEANAQLEKDFAQNKSAWVQQVVAQLLQQE